MELLLAVKADANAKNKQGETALIFAARNGYEGVVELLRQHGGHEGVKPEFAAHDRLASMAAFRKAAEEDDLKRIKAQLKYNSDLVVSNDYNGWTPLHYAVVKGKRDLPNYCWPTKPMSTSRTMMARRPYSGPRRKATRR